MYQFNEFILGGRIMKTLEDYGVDEVKFDYEQIQESKKVL